MNKNNLIKNKKIQSIELIINHINKQIKNMIEEGKILKNANKQAGIFIKYKNKYVLVNKNKASTFKELNNLLIKLEKLLERNINTINVTKLNIKENVNKSKIININNNNVIKIQAKPKRTNEEKRLIIPDTKNELIDISCKQNNKTKFSFLNLIKKNYEKVVNFIKNSIKKYRIKRENKLLLKSLYNSKENESFDNYNPNYENKNSFSEALNKINKKSKNIISKVKSYCKLKIEKIKNKEPKKINKEKVSRRTRLKAAFCAMLVAICLIPSCRSNKKTVQNSDTNKETTSQNQNNGNNDNSNTNTNENEKPIFSVEPEKLPNHKNEEENNNVSLDDNVVINNNSYIYTNCYDATNNTNPLRPYYDCNYERDIQGIVYQLDGKLYVVYETDINAYEKQKELEEKGAIATAILVTRNDIKNSGEYEGYYNINSVKTLKK